MDNMVVYKIPWVVRLISFLRLITVMGVITALLVVSILLFFYALFQIVIQESFVGKSFAIIACLLFAVIFWITSKYVTYFRYSGGFDGRIPIEKARKLPLGIDLGLFIYNPVKNWILRNIMCPECGGLMSRWNKLPRGYSKNWKISFICEVYCNQCKKKMRLESSIGGKLKFLRE